MSSPHNGRILALPLVWSRQATRAAISELPDGPHPSDEELMVRLQSNDCNALDGLFKRYSRLVFGIALRFPRIRKAMPKTSREYLLNSPSRALQSLDCRRTISSSSLGCGPSGSSDMAARVACLLQTRGRARMRPLWGELILELNRRLEGSVNDPQSRDRT